MAWLFRPTLVLAATLLLLLAPAAHGQDEVQVLRARRALSYLSSNGNGASIYRAETEVDLAVRSASYAKDVGVRFTTDGGQTHADAAAYWVGPLSDGREHWRVRLDHGTLGRNVRLGAERGDMGPLFARFSAYLRVGGHTVWGRDGAADHASALLAPVARPLPQARRVAISEARSILRNIPQSKCLIALAKKSCTYHSSSAIVVGVVIRFGDLNCTK